MTAYLVLQSVLWAALTLFFVVFNFMEPAPVPRKPFVPLAPRHDIEWGKSLVWLAILVAMTAWPIMLMR